MKMWVNPSPVTPSILCSHIFWRFVFCPMATRDDVNTDGKAVSEIDLNSRKLFVTATRAWFVSEVARSNTNSRRLVNTRFSAVKKENDASEILKRLLISREVNLRFDFKT